MVCCCSTPRMQRSSELLDLLEDAPHYAVATSRREEERFGAYRPSLTNEILPQHRARTVQARLHVRFRDAEGFRRLFGAQPFHFTQDKYLAISDGQLVDCAFQHSAQF